MTRPVYGSVADLFEVIGAGRAWRVEPMDKHVDSLSGSLFERGVIGDETFVVKHIAPRPGPAHAGARFCSMRCCPRSIRSSSAWRTNRPAVTCDRSCATWPRRWCRPTGRYRWLSTGDSSAMAAAPHTFVHGDWKFGNLGTLPDGRTVLLDRGWPGEAPPCVDLARYLAVNGDRLPESKEDTIAAFREALERRGVDGRDWWDRQLDLALLGAFVQLGWSKAADPAELAWWTDRVVATARTLP